MLCAGLGFFILWRQAAFVSSSDLTCQVEKDDFCRQIIDLRMREGFLPGGPVERDVQTVTPPPNARGVGGGFPCQAFLNLFVNFVFASTVILASSAFVLLVNSSCSEIPCRGAVPQGNKWA